MLVSTIIPVYNRSQRLRKAVESVLDQSWRPIEIIIVDDGSTDDTADTIAQLVAEHGSVIKPVLIANGGPGLAREAGRKIAGGEFIQYLDSDDLLYPEKFSKQVAALQTNPQAGVAYCRTDYLHNGGLRTDAPGKRCNESIDTMWPSFLVSRWWSTLTPLYRCSVCDLAGPWSALRQEEDWEYESRVAVHAGALCFVDEALCAVQHHAEHRLSGGDDTLKMRLSHRAAARRLIYDSATKAGLGAALPEMQHFSRSAFLLSRQCGAAGLTQEAKSLFALSRQASGRPNGLQYHLYQALTSLLGWRVTGNLSALLDRLRQPARRI